MESSLSWVTEVCSCVLCDLLERHEQTKLLVTYAWGVRRGGFFWGQAKAELAKVCLEILDFGSSTCVVEASSGHNTKL